MSPFLARNPGGIQKLWFEGTSMFGQKSGREGTNNCPSKVCAFLARGPGEIHKLSFEGISMFGKKSGRDPHIVPRRYMHFLARGPGGLQKLSFEVCAFLATGPEGRDPQIVLRRYMHCLARGPGGIQQMSFEGMCIFGKRSGRVGFKNCPSKVHPFLTGGPGGRDPQIVLRRYMFFCWQEVREGSNKCP